MSQDPDLVCPSCRGLNSRHAQFCAGCGQQLSEASPPPALRLWRGVVLSAALAVLVVGIIALVAIRVGAELQPPPLQVAASQLVGYTPGADPVALVCSRCRGTGADPQRATACIACEGRGQVQVALRGRRLAVTVEDGRPCPRCNGSGFLPWALAGSSGTVAFRHRNGRPCQLCAGTGKE